MSRPQGSSCQPSVRNSWSITLREQRSCPAAATCSCQTARAPRPMTMTTPPATRGMRAAFKKGVSSSSKEGGTPSGGLLGRFCGTKGRICGIGLPEDVFMTLEHIEHIEAGRPAHVVQAQGVDGEALLQAVGARLGLDQLVLAHRRAPTTS